MPGTFTQDLVGLIKRDDFNRPNDPLLGGDWTDYEHAGGTAEILNQLARCTAGLFKDGGGYQYPPALPADFIIQMSSDHVSGTGDYTLSLAVQWNGVTVHVYPYADEYFLHYSYKSGQLLLRKCTPVTGLQQLDFASWPAVKLPSGFRLVVESLGGGNQELRGYAAELLSINDLSQMFTPLVDGIDVVKTSNYWGFWTSNDVADHNNFQLCGRNVTVSGVPSGWKVKLIGGALSMTPQVSDGTPVVVNVDTFPLPLTGIEIYDDEDNLNGSYSGDVWGGDEYSYVPDLWKVLTYPAATWSGCKDFLEPIT